MIGCIATGEDVVQKLCLRRFETRASACDKLKNELNWCPGMYLHSTCTSFLPINPQNNSPNNLVRTMPVHIDSRDNARKIEAAHKSGPVVAKEQDVDPDVGLAGEVRRKKSQRYAAATWPM